MKKHQGLENEIKVMQEKVKNVEEQDENDIEFSDTKKHIIITTNFQISTCKLKY